MWLLMCPFYVLFAGQPPFVLSSVPWFRSFGFLLSSEAAFLASVRMGSVGERFKGVFLLRLKVRNCSDGR